MLTGRGFLGAEKICIPAFPVTGILGTVSHVY